MPYIKVVSIRNSVAGGLKYIANPDKTEEQVYLSSLNCSEDISVAEQEFCLTYQHYFYKNFYSAPNKNVNLPSRHSMLFSHLRRENVLRKRLTKSELSGYKPFSEKIFRRLFVPIPTARIFIITFVCVLMIWTELNSTAIKNLLNISVKPPMRFAEITGLAKWKSRQAIKVIFPSAYVMANGNTVNSVLRGNNLYAGKLIILSKILPIWTTYYSNWSSRSL